MTYSTYDHVQRKKHSSFFKNFLKLFVFFIGVTACFTLIFFFIDTINTKKMQAERVEIISPIGEPIPTTVSGELENVVKKSLEGTKGTYGIAIKNLRTGEEYYQQEHLVFEAASLYKLWVMLTAYDQIRSGTLKEDTSMSDSVQNLNKRFAIASESAELQEGNVAMTVDTALERMITLSHNYPALLLSARVRLSNVDKQLLQYGLTESKLNPPKTTASDILKFYELLYGNELVDTQYSKEMIDLLARQQLNDRIPKYLPRGTRIAHKTGEIDGYKHDAGIVFTPNGDYIIVMLSRSNDPRGAAEREAELSRDVYNYFQEGSE